MDLLTLKNQITPKEFDSLAKRLKTSTPYLSQLAFGHRKPSPKLCLKLVKVEPRLTLQGLRPDIYGKPQSQVAA